MQFVVKFACIAAIFVFASCHYEVPELPSPDEVKDFKFCKYKAKDDSYICKSTYEIPQAKCELIDGKIFSDKDCTVPYKEPDEE